MMMKRWMLLLLAALVLTEHFTKLGGFGFAFLPAHDPA